MVGEPNLRGMWIASEYKQLAIGGRYRKKFARPGPERKHPYKMYVTRLGREPPIEGQVLSAELLASHTIPRVSNSSESFQASAQTLLLVTSWPPRSSVVHFPERFLQQSYNGIEDFVRPEHSSGRRGNRLAG